MRMGQARLGAGGSGCAGSSGCIARRLQGVRGPGQPRTKDGLQLFPAVWLAGLQLQPGSRRSTAGRATASVGQIAGEVAQNVDQLQGFAKADGEGEEFGIIQLGVRKQCRRVRRVQNSPTQPATDRCSRPSPQRFAGNSFAASPNRLRSSSWPRVMVSSELICPRSKAGVCSSSAMISGCIRDGVRRRPVVRARDGRSPAWGTVAHAVAVLSQLEHAFIRGDQLGVGDYVGGAGEQVKEPIDCRTSGSTRRVKRLRYITENRPEQFVRGVIWG